MEKQLISEFGKQSDEQKYFLLTVYLILKKKKYRLNH